MVLSEIAQRIARLHPDYADDTIKHCTKLIVEQLDESLVMGRNVQIRGFGTFSLRRRAARKARDPRNGATVILPETHVPHFKVSPKLHQLVNQHPAVSIKHEILQPDERAG